MSQTRVSEPEESNERQERVGITLSVWFLRAKNVATTGVQLLGFGLIIAGAYGFFYPSLATQWMAQTGSALPQSPLQGLTPMFNLGVSVLGMVVVYLTTR